LAKSKTLSRINSSYNISGLIPKEYDITISAADFQSWNKKIEVHSGFSTEIWNSILVRNSYEKTAYDSSGIDKFFISPKNKYAVFDQKIEDALALKILNIKKLEAWDGIYNGKTMPTSDYWFVVNYHILDVPKTFKAHFSLKR